MRPGSRKERLFNFIQNKGVVTTTDIYDETSMDIADVSKLLISLEKENLVIYTRGAGGRKGKVELKK